jgi:succinoglycan biosynthesis transport protein ExoP
MYSLPESHMHAAGPGEAGPAPYGRGTPHRTEAVQRRQSRFPEVTADGAMIWVLERPSLIVFMTIIGVLAGLAFAMLAKPSYVASTDIMVPPSNFQVLPSDLYNAPQQQSDAQLLDIQTKLQLITSGNVLKRVVHDLKLDSVPEFSGTEDSPLSPIMRLFSAPPAETDKIESAVRTLAKRIKIERQAGTYLASVSVSARTPETAVNIAQSLNRSFMSELTQADVDLASEATSTLESRLAELRRSATDAAAAAATFRQQNGLQASAGELMSAQTLTQINAKRVDAEQLYMQRKARYDLLAGKKGDSTGSTEVLQSPGLTAARQQYDQLNQSYADMAQVLGPRHPQLLQLKERLAMAKAAVSDELERLKQAAKLEMTQAKAVFDDLTRQMTKARDSVSMDTNAQVKLDELDRDARTKMALYESFLKRAGETNERQQINLTNVRIVSRPLLPERRSFPPPTLLLAGGGGAAGLILGLLMAGMFGFLAEARVMRMTSRV